MDRQVNARRRESAMKRKLRGVLNSILKGNVSILLIYFEGKMWYLFFNLNDG